jgi:NADH-quinone oxidoreductase subunit B
MGLEDKLPEGIITTQLETLVNWSRENSTWPLLFGLACCAIEMIAAGSARHDISRYGSELFRASPRQADLMIVSGRVSNKMAPVIKRLYDQMSEPKWVIAMGICASAGGPFNNYAIIQGVDKIIPVDVYVPGCPPRPEALLYALDKLREKQGKDVLPHLRQELAMHRPHDHRSRPTTLPARRARCARPQLAYLRRTPCSTFLHATRLRNTARSQPARHSRACAAAHGRNSANTLRLVERFWR